MSDPEAVGGGRAALKERNNGATSDYELEALEPEAMMGDLDRTIRAALDIDLFNREVEIEREESAYLVGTKSAAIEALRDRLELLCAQPSIMAEGCPSRRTPIPARRRRRG